ncbi:MAG: hypothetical protein NC123_14960 [Butyrivibrio sp.]|nr:hypothetical protein [Butyrivibrio sp.]
MLEQNFDMEAYIKQRLAEITDTDERSVAKEALLKGMLPAIRVMEEQYRNLENRIRGEIEIPGSRFAVYTLAVRRQDYDAANRTWFPVCGEDIQEGAVCRRIYFQGTAAEKREFEKAACFSATDREGNMRRFGVRKAESYRLAMESLYRLFVYNRIPWRTVNTGDLDRFYDVRPMESDDDMEGWSLSFGEWDRLIRRDCILLWNLEQFTFRCMKFMVPCPDGKYYEHELDLEEYDPDSGYMVEGNEDIVSIRYEKGRIRMTSLKETFENWRACRFSGHLDMESYGYGGRVLGNARKESFADHLTERYGQGIHSRTEIFRIVKGLGVDEWVRLADCRVREREQEGSFRADMNWFIREELFPMETRRVLELTFERQGGTEADAEDMLRYVISQVQMLLDEYKCVGKM